MSDAPDAAAPESVDQPDVDATTGTDADAGHVCDCN